MLQVIKNYGNACLLRQEGSSGLSNFFFDPPTSLFQQQQTNVIFSQEVLHFTPKTAADGTLSQSWSESNSI